MNQKRFYVPAFDGIRAISAVAVLVNHTATICGAPETVFTRICWKGACGVDVFFVLSGFLITWILTTELEGSGNIRLSRFYQRRALRLLPAFFTAVTAAILLSRWQGESFFAMRWQIFAMLTYTFNLVVAFRGWYSGPLNGYINQTWTLCVEEQFYLVWPFILRRLGPRRALYFALVLIAAAVIHRNHLCEWAETHGVLTDYLTRIGASTDTRIDQIFIGCAAALAYRLGWLRKLEAFSRYVGSIFSYSSIALAGLILFDLVPLPFNPLSTKVGMLALTIGLSILAIFLQPRTLVARVLSLKPLVALGRISYGFYLFHKMIVILVHNLVPHCNTLPGTLVTMALAFAITTLVSWVHYYAIERRFLNLMPSAPQPMPLTTAVAAG